MARKRKLITPQVTSKRIRWASIEGRERALDRLAEERFANYDVSAMTQDWWEENVKDCYSKLLATCRVCEHVCRTSQISDLQQGQSFGCWCNGRVPWAGEAGRAQALKMLAAERFANYDVSAMTPEWWKENVKDCYSKLLATCRVCEHVCRTSQISDLQQGQSFGCWCNGRVPWAGEAGRAQALKMLAAERFANYDVSAMTPEWWKENIKDCHSKLLATCRVCERVCRTTRISDLQQGGSFGCLCRNKTERKLHGWLLQEYRMVAFQVPGCINPATGRTLPFDFGLRLPRRLVLVELDGRIGHFGRDFRGVENLDHAKRDFFKESWALAQQHSVVRVLQEDVWFDRGDWQGYLQQSISRAQESPQVCCPPASEYLAGVYTSLRSAPSSGATSLCARDLSDTRQRCAPDS